MRRMLIVWRSEEKDVDRVEKRREEKDVDCVGKRSEKKRRMMFV